MSSEIEKAIDKVLDEQGGIDLDTPNPGPGRLPADANEQWPQGGNPPQGDDEDDGTRKQKVLRMLGNMDDYALNELDNVLDNAGFNFTPEYHKNVPRSRPPSDDQATEES